MRRRTIANSSSNLLTTLPEEVIDVAGSDRSKGHLPGFFGILTGNAGQTNRKNTDQLSRKLRATIWEVHQI